MNDQDFILLLEQYLDGSITPDGRQALREAVEADPERRRLFETHTRQHVKLHAQTTRVDFTESQRVAVMVMDVVEKEHEAHFSDLLREQTLRERWQAVRQGLRAPPTSESYRYARFALLRLFGPATLSIIVNAAILLLILFYALPEPPSPEPTGPATTIDLLNPGATAPAPEPAPVAPPDKPPQAGEHPSATGPSEPAERGTPPGPEAPSAPPGHADGQPPANDPVPTLVLLPRGPAFRMLPGSDRPMGLPGDLAGRTPDGRRRILGDNGGTTNSEKAVMAALHWLKARQFPDGSWAGQDPAAMTGLALLAYLAHGELPGSPEFGHTIRAGLDHLLARQGPEGAFSKNVYAHAIATYAICEAYTLTRVVSLREPMNKAVRIIVASQQPGGGYDYDYQLGTGRFDTSVTGWQIQALKAARLAGVDPNVVEPALARCAGFLKTQAFARDGSGFVYTGTPGMAPASGATRSMTAVGTLCLDMLQEQRAPQARAGLKALEKAEFTWPANGDKAPVYGGYYLAQVKFQQGNKQAWKRWNEAFQHTLLLHQGADGHWEGGDYDRGTHVYTTTLCTLMLEVYYRYLPTYGVMTNAVDTVSAEGFDVAVKVQ